MLKRPAKRLVVYLVATVLAAAALVMVQPATAGASTIVSNCSIVTCSIYADKQTTRTLDHYYNSPEGGLGTGVAQAAVCELLKIGSLLCSAASLISSYDLGSALRSAVNNTACLQFKYPNTATFLGGWFTYSSNSNYCKDGSPPFSDGTLVKQSSLPQVFVVYGGAKFLIPNPTSFSQLGFSWSAIRTISDKDFRNVPLIPAQNTVLREYTIPTVFIIENGHKRAVGLSEYLAKNYGARLHYVPDGALYQIPG